MTEGIWLFVWRSPAFDLHCIYLQEKVVWRFGWLGHWNTHSSKSIIENSVVTNDYALWLWLQWMLVDSFTYSCFRLLRCEFYMTNDFSLPRMPRRAYWVHPRSLRVKRRRRCCVSWLSAATYWLDSMLSTRTFRANIMYLDVFGMPTQEVMPMGKDEGIWDSTLPRVVWSIY